ncbi:MAG: hypothetical protein HDS70_06115 [Bacteroidales bacterium]|nr:hypothetical protein [Bacteroidales bacterium]
MRKLLYLAGCSALLFAVASCGHGGKSAEEMAADSARVADSIAMVKADSLAKVQADSIAKASKGAEIDKLLSKFASQVKDIRDGFYDNGQFYPPSGMGVHAFINPCWNTDKKLKALKGEMTPEQLKKYNMLRNRVKEIW